MRELYELHDPQYANRYTVPVLWDSQTKKIVNNESSEIIRMLNTEFNAFAKVSFLSSHTHACRVACVVCVVCRVPVTDEWRDGSTLRWTCTRPSRGRRSMPSTRGCTRPSTTASTSAASPPRRPPVRRPRPPPAPARLKVTYSPPPPSQHRRGGLPGPLRHPRRRRGEAVQDALPGRQQAQR